MASSNFDELTKVLATSTSRRQTIRVLFASVLGGTLGFGGIDAAQAAEDCGGSTNNCGDDKDNFRIWNSIQDCVNNNKCSPDVVGHTKHWVLYQDTKDTNYTLFAGERVKGIECHKIWDSGAQNYWKFAWEAAQKHLDSHKGKIGLAINSKVARMQCQLHIHVSCIQTSVQTQLESKDSQITSDPNKWKTQSKLSLEYIDHTVSGSPQKKTRDFRVLRLDNLDQNLFWLLRDKVVGYDADMQYQTLVVTVGPKGKFYILNSMDNGHGSGFSGTGAGEALLDETCKS